VGRLELSPIVEDSKVEGYALSKSSGKFTRWMEFTPSEMQELYALVTEWKRWSE